MGDFVEDLGVEEGDLEEDLGVVGYLLGNISSESTLETLPCDLGEVCVVS